MWYGIVTGGQELTAVMLLRLALRMRVRDLAQIRNFLVVGLNIESNVIDGELAEYSDFNLAMFNVFLQWRVSWEDVRAAYTILVHALRNAKMDKFIKETLEIEEETEVAYSNEGI